MARITDKVDDNSNVPIHVDHVDYPWCCASWCFLIVFRRLRSNQANMLVARKASVSLGGACMCYVYTRFADAILRCPAASFCAFSMTLGIKLYTRLVSPAHHHTHV